MATTVKEMVAEARSRIREVSPAEAQSRLEEGGVALDVRELDELEEGHVPGAVHIPRGFLEFKAPGHDALQRPDTPINVYCKGAGRAALAADTLQRLGYTDVVSIEGGFGAWQNAGLEIQRPDAARDEEE